MEIRRLLICFLLGLMSISINAQSFTEAYRSAFEIIKSKKSIGYEVFFISKSGYLILNRDSMKVEKLGNTSYSYLNGLESYLINDVSIIIDHESKRALVNEGSTSREGELFQKLELIEQIEKEAKSHFTDTVDTVVRHTLFFEDMDFKTVKIELNKETGLFIKISFSLAKPISQSDDPAEPKVEIIELKIDNYNLNPKKLSSPWTSYFSKVEGRYQLNPSYKHYKFISNYDLR